MFGSREPYLRDFLNSSSVSPLSCMMPPMVYALTGLFRGIVMKRVPSDMTMCFLPSLTIWKPHFFKPRTA